MASDDFIHRAEAELGAATREENALAAQEEGVRRKRADLQQRMTELRDSIRVYRELMELGAEAKSPSVGMFDNIPLGSITDMAYAIIERQGAPMKVADIARTLVGAGKLKPNGTGKSSNYATVFGILRRDRRFAKMGEGTFGLAGLNGQTSPSAPPLPDARSLSSAQD